MNHFKKSLLTLGCMAVLQMQASAFAASTLTAGDIAVIQMNTDAPDSFTFVTFVDLDASTVINFTDNGWKSKGEFRSKEDTVIWTSPARKLAAGTIVTIEAGLAQTVGSFSGSLSSLSKDGDSIIAYQGSENAPTLIYALNNSGSGWQSGKINSNESTLSGQLSDGVTAVALTHKDNYKYDGYTTGDKSTLLMAISDSHNWTGDNHTQQIFSKVEKFTVNTDSSTPPLPTAGDKSDYTPGTLITTSNSDTSTAIKIGTDYILVGDDEASELRIYPVAGGGALTTWDFSGCTETDDDEVDIEASAKIGSIYYFLGSHSNKSNGKNESTRERLFAVTIANPLDDATFSCLNGSSAYEKLLTQLDTDFSAYGFDALAAEGVRPESKLGFSLEGMTETTDGKLLLGFRAPQVGTISRDKAIVVTLSSPNDVLLSGANANLLIQEIDLGGRGIRSMYTREDGSYLLIAGPSGGASPDVDNDFVFFTWDGTSQPTQLDNNLDDLLKDTKGSVETIVDVDSNNIVHLLQDNGDTIWDGKTKRSKKLPASEQKFVGNWVALGAEVNDTQKPILKSQSPDNNATNVATTTKITLTFDEYVLAGQGDFTLSGGGANIVISATDAQINGGVVTLTLPNELLGNTTYTVTANSDALTDASSNKNAWVDLTGTIYQFTTIDPNAAVNYDLLISEVNSKANGGDFFELYNYGATDIVLSGWKWAEDKADFDFTSSKATLIANAKVNAGDTLVITKETDASTFKTLWGLPASANVLKTDGKGLGKNDGVVLFDSLGNVVAVMNYGESDITVLGQTIPPATSKTGKTQGGHAGASFGGSDTVSAVWDGVSTTNPAYVAAEQGKLGGVEQSIDSGSIGSPGHVTTNSPTPSRIIKDSFE